MSTAATPPGQAEFVQLVGGQLDHLVVVHLPEVLLPRDDSEAGVVDEDVDAAELGLCPARS